MNLKMYLRKNILTIILSLMRNFWKSLIKCSVEKRAIVGKSCVICFEIFTKRNDEVILPGKSVL